MALFMYKTSTLLLYLSFRTITAHSNYLKLIKVHHSLIITLHHVSLYSSAGRRSRPRDRSVSLTLWCRLRRHSHNYLGGRKGIGKVITETLLAEGANVSYCSRNVTGEEFATFKGAIGGARAVGTSVDIADPESIKAWVESAAETFGRIDIVVANGEPGREPSKLNVQLTFP